MTAPGVFYPPMRRAPRSASAYYASQFPLVEVDATYYALPPARMSELWRDRTPPDFTFDVKAHALMTGQPTETRRLPKWVRDELPGRSAPRRGSTPGTCPTGCATPYGRRSSTASSRCARPVSSGSILLQYPKWFFPIGESRDLILEARERLDGLQVAVEFRNATWFNEKNAERTLRFLGDHEHPVRDGRCAAGLQEQRAGRAGGDVTRARDGPVPRPQRGDLGGEGHHASRAVPIPL